MMTVRNHFTKYGPRGVPKGRVEVQNAVKGRTPCLVQAVSLRFLQLREWNSH